MLNLAHRPGSKSRFQFSWSKSCCLKFLLWFIVLQVSYEDDAIASKQQFKESENLKRRCPYMLRKLWQTDISSFPFAASPLIADVNGDDKYDIVAAPYGETITVVEGDTGKHLDGSGWPRHNLDKSIHSSPLQFDIDGDGVLDLLFITSKGEGLFYTKDGYQLHVYNFQCIQYMYLNCINPPTPTLFFFSIFFFQSPGYIPVDPHVFDTPVLHDKRFLVIPLSFYFSDDDYSDDQKGPWGDDAKQRDKYYVTAVAVVDLEKLHLGVQERKGKSPVFNLFSPTVVDVDCDFSESEIIIGSSSGSLYVLTWDGKHRQGFPQTFGSISGRLTAVNLDEAPGMELIVPDKTGNVTCVDAVSAKTKWSARVGGTNFAGSSVVDVDMDGQLDIVVATSEGNVFAINGVTGGLIPNYPYKASKGISGNVLVTKFNMIRGPYDLANDGILHILASDLSCESQVALADTSLVDILLHDLSPLTSRGLEVLVSTSDGSLVCLGSGQSTPPEELVEDESKVIIQRLALPSSSTNRLISLDKVRIAIWLWACFYYNLFLFPVIQFFFFFIFAMKSDSMLVLCLPPHKVYMGNELVHADNKIEGSQGIQSVTIHTPEQPGQAQITVLIFDKTGHFSQDTIHLRFNQLILQDLQWLVLSPFIAMIIILLVNHGFPAKDLLPVTFPFKSK
ncbi:hypothetical protein EGW08_018737 [Elysia chlorotica]|uniref:DEX1 C-terminal domain-containing protein n=1 Tax=Elysia chlorotica TaxID=188477 RepID=A0A3S1B0Z2_ELYCH|nr:hypothetical protein EGW08_018737 [Elysia chlorotica]